MIADFDKTKGATYRGGHLPLAAPELATGPAFDGADVLNLVTALLETLGVEFKRCSSWDVLECRAPIDAVLRLFLVDPIYDGDLAILKKDEVIDLIAQSIIKDPVRRITTEEIADHPLLWRFLVVRPVAPADIETGTLNGPQDASYSS